jgi:tetratricopeptide (TPR) repeat protein
VRPATIVALAALVIAPSAARAHLGVEELGDRLDAEIIRHPEQADLHLERARVYLLAQRVNDALAELDLAARQGADRDVVGTTRGEALLAAGDARAARAELDRVLRRNRDAYGTLFARGRVWLALGNPKHAADDFGRAIAGLKMPRPEHVIARRDALLSLGRRAAALRALDEGMARIGHVASLELAAIDLELDLGRDERALGRLERLLATTPANPVWVARRADILRRTGRMPEARAEYARALTMIAGRRAPAFEDLRQHVETALAESAREENP